LGNGGSCPRCPRGSGAPDDSYLDHPSKISHSFLLVLFYKIKNKTWESILSYVSPWHWFPSPKLNDMKREIWKESHLPGRWNIVKWAWRSQRFWTKFEYQKAVMIFVPLECHKAVMIFVPLEYQKAVMVWGVYRNDPR
jgi:hypothetical protein